MQGIRHKWHLDELHFLKLNYFEMTNDQLLDVINSKRSNPVCMSTMRHQCKRMGLQRQVQIRWSKSDAKFLKDNFRTIGNTELAKKLNERKKSYRVIKGKKVYKIFDKKLVHRKMVLLNLQRTDEELKEIRKKLIDSGKANTFTSTDNLWSRGIKTKCTEGETRIHKNCLGKPLTVIKINNKFIPYARWYYLNFIGPIPKGMFVFHIDRDPLNDDPENLEVRKSRNVSQMDRQRAIPLLEKRLEQQQGKLESAKGRLQQIEAQKEFARIRNILKKLNEKLNHANNKPTQSNRYYTGEVS